MPDCIFCKIIKKEIPSNIVYETDNLIVFPDINPSADTHFLIVPKEHIPTVSNLTSEHVKLLTEIYQTANKLVQDNNLQNSAYKIVVNGGKAQHVPHIHFHLLAGNLKKMV